MSQADYDIANQAGAAFRADLNTHLAAIVSNNSGATEPSTTFAYQWWADTTTGLLKIRNAANSGWVTVGTLASAYLGAVRNTGNETIAGNKTFSGVTAIGGTATNDDAAVGYVGEVVSSTVLIGSAVALTSGVAANVTSISLTAGHWRAEGRVAHNTGASTSVTQIAGSISQTSSTHDKGFSQAFPAVALGAGGGFGTACPGKTIKVSGPTTIYLVASATFTSGAMTAHGEITATRVR